MPSITAGSCRRTNLSLRRASRTRSGKRPDQSRKARNQETSWSLAHNESTHCLATRGNCFRYA
jgi:hypothetical protein